MSNANTMYEQILGIIETRSTCARLQVGAILVKNDRIISTGWNGVPSKHEHCDTVFSESDRKSVDFLECHRVFSEDNELHAEQNCIAAAAKAGISTENSDIYITYSPCKQCAKLIIAAGVKKVFYKYEYDRHPYKPGFLENSGVEVINFGV